jgi:hypothetical protein
VYHRLNVSAVNGSSNLSIKEIAFVVAAPATTTTVTATSTVTATATATATVTAAPTSMALDDNQFGFVALCGGLVVFCLGSLMVMGFRR